MIATHSGSPLSVFVGTDKNPRFFGSLSQEEEDAVHACFNIDELPDEVFANFSRSPADKGSSPLHLKHEEIQR